jgi:hypothetical protein
MPVAVILIFWMFGKSFWKSVIQEWKKIFVSKAWKRVTGKIPPDRKNTPLPNVPTMKPTKSSPLRRINLGRINLRSQPRLSTLPDEMV